MITDQTNSGRTYHHNGDFSGEVRIIMDPREVEHASFAGQQYVTVTISSQDLVEIVGQYARRERLSALERTDAYTLLGLDVPPPDAYTGCDCDPSWPDHRCGPSAPDTYTPEV